MSRAKFKEGDKVMHQTYAIGSLPGVVKKRIRASGAEGGIWYYDVAPDNDPAHVVRASERVLRRVS